MDLTTIRSRVSDFLNDSSTSRWSQATRDAFINIAYHEICNADTWPFREATDSSVNTVSGTSAYTLPTTINLPLGMWLTSINAENKLFSRSRKERDTFDFSATGRPCFYFRFGSQFYLYPTPNAVYNIIMEYQRKVTDLSAISDEPIFEADFHYLVPMLAAAKLKKTSGGNDVDDARDLIAEVQNGINEMRARLLPRDLDRKKQVQVLYEGTTYSNSLPTIH